MNLWPCRGQNGGLFPRPVLLSTRKAPRFLDFSEGDSLDDPSFPEDPGAETATGVSCPSKDRQ